MKILDIGSGKTNGPEMSWPDAEVFRVDIDAELEPDFVHDITKPLPEEMIGKFDVVFCSHILEHISWRDVTNTLQNVSKAVVDGGQMYIIVPDIAWACEQVLAGKYSLGVVGVLYGAQFNEWQYHRTGFTKEALATMLRTIGWKVLGWKVEPFIVIMNGVKEIAKQIVVVAERDNGG